MSGKELLKKYNSPENFFNRDLSWLEFNRRVLEEALDPDLPLLEKVKFISIFSSNLDEYYMIRVSGLKEQVDAGVLEPTIDGLTPREQVRKIEITVQEMIRTVEKIWFDEIIPGLEENGIIITHTSKLNEDEKKSLHEYFKHDIFPVLTPLAFDPGRPFPYISNLSLSLAVLISAPNGEKRFARVKVPSTFPRLLEIDKIIDPNYKRNVNGNFHARFIWVGDIIKENLSLLFPGMEILEAHRFRITRDTDIELQEDEADDLLRVIEENIRQRRFGNVVRLEVAKAMPEFMLDTLIENLEITREDVHILEGPLGLSDIMSLYDLPLHQLKEKPYYPVIPEIFEEEEDIFSIIKHKDVLLHHPYFSFSPVIDLIKNAARDPDVLAIKQTLYRVGTNSPILKYLIEAAERGKQVAVLVELKARFDEQNNIFWARELEKVGIHVVYGLVGLKTHAKMTLIVRREFEGMKRYVHLSTGNYNATTAKLYTDLGLFTDDEAICSDVTEVFNYLTGYSKQHDFRKLFVAPIALREKFLELINNEIENAKSGKNAHIIFKLNSIVDPIIISALYEASNNGVKIDLMVRGICCLVPGKQGLSENIKVKSVVGRFLEHSRIFYFENDSNPLIYFSSADIMQRNLDRRVEIAFPIEETSHKEYIIDKVLKWALKDNVKGRELREDMKYYKIENGKREKKINSQESLMEHAVKSNKKLIKNKL